MAITLVYTDSGTTYTLSLNTLSMRGVSEPDELRMVSVQHKYLDGSSEEQIRGFQKVITIDFGVIQVPAYRRFLVQFIKSEVKSIVYGTIASSVVNDNPNLATNWINDVEHGRRFIIRLVDSHLYTMWDDGSSDEDDVIIKHDILLVGTSSSPESFTTGSGKLTVDDAGKAFPAFDGTVYSYGVIPIMSNGCQATMHASTPTVSGGNLVFTLWYGDSYTPAPDGNMYVSIYILRESKL